METQKYPQKVVLLALALCRKDPTTWVVLISTNRVKSKEFNIDIYKLKGIFLHNKNTGVQGLHFFETHKSSICSLF